MHNSVELYKADLAGILLKTAAADKQTILSIDRIVVTADTALALVSNVCAELCITHRKAFFWNTKSQINIVCFEEPKNC